jgi:ligand-binding sensor domain-containing protein
MQHFLKTYLSCLILLLAVFSYSQERKFIKFSIADGLPQSQIRDVIQDENGFLWVATNGGGVARYDGKEFKIFNKSNGLISNGISVVNYNNGLTYIGTKNGLSIITNTEVLNFKCPSIHKILFKDDLVYLATNKGIKTLRDLKYIKSEILGGLIDNSIVYDIEFADKNYYIKNSNGLFTTQSLFKNSDIKELDATFKFQKQKYIEAIQENSIVVNVIGINSINKVLTDSQSNTWVASERGLYKIYKSNFENYLKGNRITSINNLEEKFLIGTSKSLIHLDSLGIFKRIDNRKVHSIINNKKQFFVGTDTGIVVLDSLKVVDTLFKQKIISNLLIKNETIWAVEKNNGIASFKYDFETKLISNLLTFNKSDGVYDLKINDLYLDSVNRLWFVTQQGFLGYIKNNIVKHLGKVLKFDVEINSLLIHNNTLFLGTKGQGVWWSALDEGLIFNKLVGTKKLYAENISQLLFDNNNNLWIGSHKGVDKVSLSSENEIFEVTHFAKNNGFEGVETAKNAISKDSFGDIWFGTINGLSKYNDIETERIITDPNIFFDQIEVAYKSLDSIKLVDWTNSSNKLYLKPTDNHISFSFRTVDLTFAEDIQYRWRLNTSDWSPWTKDRKVNYSSLNAGDYTFEAQSRIFNANLSEPIRFQFNVDLPLIQKPWFKQLLLISGLLLLFWIIRNYFQKMKRKNEREKEALKAENHLLSLEQKALQLQMNPHFIFNVLNGIKAMGAKDTVKMNETVNKFAVLLRLTLSNSRKEHISLSEEISTLRNYIEIEESMSYQSFEYEIIPPSDFDAEEILIPPMLIQPFVENAIRHGISTIENGKLLINFSVKNEQLLCVIQDNGIGIEVSKQNKTKTNHQSMALDVTKERIESLSGKNTFEIEEIKDENQVVLGTKVSFKIPLLTDY